MLKGKTLYLRAVEPEDANILYEWENDPFHWQVSHTLLPFSRETMKRFVDNPPDFHADKQARFMISRLGSEEPIGCIDLFEYEPFHSRAGIGILIAEGNRYRGVGKEALTLITEYAFEILCLRQLFCNIVPENQSSIKLFTNSGFEIVGTKKNWLRTSKGFKDEVLLQKINPDWIST